MASWTDKYEDDELADPEVDDAAKRRKGVASGSPTAGDTNAEGQKERWRALEHACFVPDLESKKKLLETLESNNTYQAAYEWLKGATLLCEFIVPGIK